MGIVKVTENKGDGLYAVEVVKDTARAANNKILIDESISKLEAVLENKSLRLPIVQNQLFQLGIDMDALINAGENTDEKLKQIIEKSAERDQLIIDIKHLEFMLAAKRKKSDELTSVINSVDARDIWCADFRDDLATDAEYVSIEVIQQKEKILIAPYTYVVQQVDIDNKQATVDDENDILDDINQQITDIDNEISSTQLSIEATEIDILNYIGPDITPLFDKLYELIEKKALLISEREKLIRIKNKQVAKINRLNFELSELNSALASESGIIEPAISQYTKQLQPTQSSAPVAVFFNRSLLPGVQKWQPTFRTGEITAKSGNVCDVTLDVAESVEQGLLINREETLINVPIKYGDCNGEVFDVGDKVVVKFREREQSNPEVIGFVDNPKPCALNIVCLFVDTIKNGHFIEVDPKQVKPNQGYPDQTPFSTTSFYVQFGRISNRMYWVDAPGDDDFFSVAETKLINGNQSTKNVLTGGPLTAERTIAGVYKTNAELLILTETDTATSPTVSANVRVYDSGYNQILSFSLPTGVYETVSVAGNDDRIVVISRFNDGPTDNVWVYNYSGDLVTSYPMPDFVSQVNVSEAKDRRFFILSIKDEVSFQVLQLDKLGNQVADITIPRGSIDDYTGVKATQDAIYLFRSTTHVSEVIQYQGHIDKYIRTLEFDDDGNIITDSISTTISETFNVGSIGPYQPFAIQ